MTYLDDPGERVTWHRWAQLAVALVGVGAAAWFAHHNWGAAAGGGLSIHELARGKGNVRALRKALIHKPALAAERDDDGKSPLRAAVEANQPERVVALMEGGADPFAADADGLSPLMAAAGSPPNNLAGNALFNSLNRLGPLGVTWRRVSAPGPGPAGSGRTDWTPAHWAAYAGNYRAITELRFRGGVNFNVGDNFGSTAAHLAADLPPGSSSRLAMQKTRTLENLVLAVGADLRLRDANGETPLHIASKTGFEEGAKTLLNFGADANAKNANGATALHLAAAGGHEKVLDELLAKSADLSAKNNAGQTPADVARAAGHEILAQKLETTQP